MLEYWPVDPRNDTVTQLELRDGEYVERAVLGTDDTLTTPLLPGLPSPWPTYSATAGARRGTVSRGAS